MRYNLASPLWENYSYDRLYRLTDAEYGVGSGLALNATTDYTDFNLLVKAALVWLNETIDKNPVNPVNPVKEYSAAEIAQIKRQILSILYNVSDPQIAKLIHSIRTVTPVAYNPDAPVLRLVELGDEIPAGYRAETCFNDANDIIAQIVWDNNDRMVLFAMYPDAGGTVIILMGYDSQGNLTSEICITYDDNGNAVETVDMLAMQETQSFTALSLDGGSSYRMSSTPQGPPYASESFSYDHLGNRYQYTDKNGFVATYAHNPVNQYGLISLDYGVGGLTHEYTLSYDDNGNLETDEEGNSYSYDYRNRLVEVEDASFNTIAEYTYDALGRRIKKIVDDKVTYFFCDGAGQVIAEYERPDIQSPSLAREFVYGNSYNEVLAMFNPYHDGDPADLDAFIEFCDAWLSETEDPTYSTEYDHDSDGIINLEDFAHFASIWDIPSGRESNWYYLRDALGSIRGLVGGRFNREGDREFYNYDVYGKSSDLSEAGNPFLFTGYRYDSEIGLYHTPNRAYDPETGRWLQFDPIGINPSGGIQNPFNVKRQYSDGLNLYEYAKSKPIVYTDPLGLTSARSDKACCKIKTSITNYAVAGNMIIPFTQTSCNQVTISNLQGNSSKEACRCRYKNQPNVKVYGSYTGECCWCDVYIGWVTDPLPNGKADTDVSRHTKLYVKCKNRPSADFTAETTPNNPVDDGNVSIRRLLVGGVPVNPIVDQGDSMHLAGYSWSHKGRISCDVAKASKSVIANTETYWSVRHNCWYWAHTVKNTLLDTCP